MKINCLHDECMEVSVDWEPSFYQLADRTQITPNLETATAQFDAAAKFIGKVMESDEFKSRSVVARRAKIANDAIEESIAKAKTIRKKSEKTGIHITGGIVPATVEPSQENIAEKSKEKIKLLRESIIKEYKDGIS